MVYKTDDYNSSGIAVKETNSTWNAIGVDSINGVFATELLKDSTITDGVKAVTSYSYEGAPYFQTLQVTGTNSDGTIKRIKMKYPQDYSYISSTSDPFVQAIDSMQSSRHLVNTVIEKYVTQQNPPGSEQVISGEVNEYKIFNGSQALPWEQWEFNSTSAIPLTSIIQSNTGSSFIMDSHYALMQSLDSYDSFGNNIQRTNANGTVTSYKYGYNNTQQTAQIKNAKSSEESIADFEDGTCDDWNSYTNGSISTTAHTGINGWYLPYNTSDPGRIFKYFSASSLNLQGKYIFSGWVKAASPYPELECEVDTGNGIPLYPYVVFASGKGNWEYLEMTIDLSKFSNIKDIYLIARNNNSNGQVACYWDDLRFYPAGAEMTTMTYDPVTLQATSQSDASSNPTYYEYDGLGRLNQTLQMLSGVKKLINEDRTQYSSSFSNGYSPSMPNLSENILYSDSSGYSDFSSNFGWTIAGGANFNYLFDNKTTVQMQNLNSSWYDIQRQVDGQHGIARVDFYPTQTTGTTPYVLAFGSSGNRFNVYYDNVNQKFCMQVYTPGSGWVYPLTFNLSAPINHWYTVEIEKFTDGRACAYVYPKGEGRIYKTGYYYADSTYLFPTNWNPSVYSYANNTTYYLSDFYYGNPDREEVFSDGLGRKLQEQMEHNDSTIVASTFTYDSAGRVNQTFKPYEKEFSLFNMGEYDPSYYANISYYYNQGMGAYRFDSSQTAVNLYTQNVYFSDPLNRVSEEGFPGSPWSVGSGHDKRFSYSSSNNLYKTSLTDEQSIETDTYKDIFGRTVQTVQNPGGLNLTTNYAYDANDDLLSTTDPTNKQTNYTYNTLKQLTQKTSPDAGTTQYLYDKNGNMRFIKDANHNGSAENSVYITAGVNTSGSFSLTMPGTVSLYAKPNAGGSGMYCTITIKPHGSAVVLATITSTSTTVSSSVYLPIGTFDYTITIYNGNYTNYISCNTGYEFKYFKYDALNRVTEEGEYNSSSVNADFNQTNANNVVFPTSSNLVWKQYFYDQPSTAAMAAGQRNLHGRLSYVEAYKFGNASTI